MSSDSGAPTGLSEVRWTRTIVGGPNDLGGSVTAGIGAKPFSADIMRHLQKDFLKDLSRNSLPFLPKYSEEFILTTYRRCESTKVDSIIIHASC